jgi:4-amino-4-deoxy-L-arabinose transferase-like glycosyltransferase
MNARRPRLILALILCLYFALGVLFAANTPAWQAPDEPAHYNYVRYLAEQGNFPVLHVGDYPHAYLEEIKSRKFPTDLSIDPIRYEFHQPPLYYALAAPIYGLTGGDPFALRLFSVALGAGIVLLAYAITRRAFPQRPALGLGTAAFVAFLPQHLATVAQIGNDVLAELLYATVLFVLVGWLTQPANSYRHNNRRELGNSLGLGILLGLILITKTTAYIAVPLAGGVLIWRWRRERAGIRRILLDGLAVAAPALLIALPWYARDIAVYGWPDFLGLIRHDQIVVGQLRTADFVAQQGWRAYWLRAVRDTFRSFWGQFGWMGVVLDTRVYFVLLLLSGVALGGLILRGVRHGRRRLSPALILFGSCVLLTLVVYAWYNTQFLQHQGRYLFTALIPIAIFFCLGWEGALRPGAGRILAAGLAIFGFALAAWGILAGVGLPKWPLALTAAFAAGLLVLDFGLRIKGRDSHTAIEASAGFSGEQRRPAKASIPEDYLNHGAMSTLYLLAFALPFIMLPLLDLYALFGGIVPQLTR